ncbi:DUF6702 family protein [Cyclobacterium jeungdonense]|uniref:Uncharacterized protein n=1 Tax=Cyclobacterium jeungdonense TaxID=708087 RepID=A0ABT8C2Z3_9BACT|nr:DUF6702 family protein [Cyclobacterium jeungdonense]MDN3687145.1 hypothetical protein [Cyclobacterium jeungdonense]
MPLFNPITAVLSLWWLVHPFYISLTDMVYNEEHQTIEIAQKIFWNDMEVALSNATETSVDFLSPQQPDKLDSLIARYLLAHNQILIQGDTVRLQYLGHEVEGEAAWFYMESEKVPSPKQITIYNGILIDDFPEQQNIINFYKNRKPKSLLTRKGKTGGVLILED